MLMGSIICHFHSILQINASGVTVLLSVPSSMVKWLTACALTRSNVLFDLGHASGNHRVIHRFKSIARSLSVAKPHEWQRGSPQTKKKKKTLTSDTFRREIMAIKRRMISPFNSSWTAFKLWESIWDSLRKRTDVFFFYKGLLLYVRRVGIYIGHIS